MTTQSKTAKRIGMAIIILVILLALGALAIPIVFCVILANTEPFEFKSGPLIEDPKIGFTQITGLEWAENSEVITFADTHGGFLGDGEFYVIFRTDQETLEEWLSNSPPWENEEWKRGPVPPEIGFHASFGKGGMIIGSVGNGPYQYDSEGELVDLLKSDEIWYVVKERCCGRDSLYFHNGELLIVDLEAQQVWLSSWDY